MTTTNLSTTPPLTEPIHASDSFPKWRPTDQEFLLKDGEPSSRASFLDGKQITGWARHPEGLLFFYRKRAV